MEDKKQNTEEQLRFSLAESVWVDISAVHDYQDVITKVPRTFI